MNNESQSSTLKISMSSVTSNPMPDREIFKQENKNLYKIILSLIIIDFILNELIIINDCNLISSKKDSKLLLFFLFSLLSIIIFGGLLLFLYSKKLILSKIARFFYLSVGIVYYAFQVTLKILIFAKNDFKLKPFDIILFIIISLTLIPRIVGFLYIRVYERTIKKIDGAKIAEEHEMFIEKVVGNLDRSTNNNLKEQEFEKELDKPEEEEETIFKMNKDKIIADKNENNNNNSDNNKKQKRKMSGEEEVEEEEVADLS